MLRRSRIRRKRNKDPETLVENLLKKRNTVFEKAAKKIMDVQKAEANMTGDIYLQSLL